MLIDGCYKLSTISKRSFCLYILHDENANEFCDEEMRAVTTKL